MYRHAGFVKVTLFVNEDKCQVVEVSDSGIGISEEYQADIFIPFAQEEQGYSSMLSG